LKYNTRGNIVQVILNKCDCVNNKSRLRTTLLLWFFSYYA